MKSAVSIILIIMIFMHHVMLLNNLSAGKTPDLTSHFLVSYQGNPSMDFLEWISMHFSPVSKHLFDDPAHQQKNISPKCSSLFFIKKNSMPFIYFISMGRKILNTGSKGFYSYLFADEILNPPKR